MLRGVAHLPAGLLAGRVPCRSLVRWEAPARGGAFRHLINSAVEQEGQGPGPARASLSPGNNRNNPGITRECHRNPLQRAPVLKEGYSCPSRNIHVYTSLYASLCTLPTLVYTSLYASLPTMVYTTLCTPCTPCTLLGTPCRTLVRCTADGMPGTVSGAG